MKTIQQLLCMLLFLATVTLYGQDLQIPNTPAFSILGYEPTSVMRPNSNKKLTSDLLNSFDKEGKLLMNLGMEVAPFWLENRPALTREEYLDPNRKQLFLQTLSLSAATVKDTVSGLNNLGVGFRVQLVQGKLTAAFDEKETALKELETAIAAIAATENFIGSAIKTRQQAIDFMLKTLKQINTSKENIVWIEEEAYKLKERYTDTDDSIKEFYRKLIDSFEEKTNNLAKEVISFSNKRTGFSLELASAGKFITTKDNQAFNKAGIWLNANNYFTETDAWTITARFMTSTSDTIFNNLDVGLGYVKEGKKFNVSIEGLLRWYKSEIPDFNASGDAIIRLEKDLTYRLAAQLSYTIVENVNVNMSFGKDFNEAALSGSSFFSIFGLQYTIFNRQEGVLKKSP